MNASVRSFKVGHKVSLARVEINQVPDVDFATASGCALTVEVPQHISRTADVVVTVYAPAYAHPPVHGRGHQQYATWTTGGVEFLV